MIDITTLLTDHRRFHSTFQMDWLITAEAGFTPYGAYKQALGFFRTFLVSGNTDVNEMLRIEHIAFSRDVFAQGAIFAAEWLIHQREKTIFNMEHVLGIS